MTIPSGLRAATILHAAGKPVAVLAVLALFAAVAIAQQPPDALQMYRDGRYNQAVETTLGELDDNPRNMNAYSVLGWSLLALGRYEEAVEYGLQGLQVAPSDQRVLHIVGEAKFQLGDDLEALEYFQRYIAAAPQGNLVPQVYRTMGEILIRFEEYNRADIALSTAVYHNGNNAGWWARLGYAREQAQEFTTARSAYERALELNADDAEAAGGLERLP